MKNSLARVTLAVIVGLVPFVIVAPPAGAAGPGLAHYSVHADAVATQVLDAANSPCGTPGAVTFDQHMNATVAATQAGMTDAEVLALINEDPSGVIRQLSVTQTGTVRYVTAGHVYTGTFTSWFGGQFLPNGMYVQRAELLIDDEPTTVAFTGTATNDEERFPLSHQGVMLGELIIGRRVAGEPLTAGEREIVSTLARQAGVLAHNVVLVEALRRSRLVLVNAREEERRRIRADLHDGLGPTLATVAMGLEATAKRLDGAPELESLLQDLEHELQGAIQDVRSLVYELRPAALDDLGLVSAVREYARTLAQRSAATARPLDVVIDAPETLGPLPAAVEVAAYRVALEALTNVARHAGAAHCSVRLFADDGLALTIEDDGIGLAEPNNAGIGLGSMRERVAELDGRFDIRSRAGLGTVVSAWFPLTALVVE